MEKREKKLGRFLLQSRLDLGAAEGKEVSKADQADWLSDNSLDMRVPPNTYGSWEKGERLPSPDFWPVLVEKLGAHINVILGVQVEDPIAAAVLEDPRFKYIYQHWPHWDEQKRNKMRSLAAVLVGEEDVRDFFAALEGARA